jgi:hypothetical protein
MSLAWDAWTHFECLALSAFVPAFASDSLNGPRRLCTTRLATIVIDVDDPCLGCNGLATTWVLFDAGMPVPMSRN